MKDSEIRVSFEKTIDEGYTHHAARYARMRECTFKRQQNGTWRPWIDGKELSEFTVARANYRGMTWYHVYRRMNNGNLKYQYRFPFIEEAAAFIDDVSKGREKVYFKDISFRKKLPGGK
jgi:hypothetical protein